MLDVSCWMLVVGCIAILVRWVFRLIQSNNNKDKKKNRGPQ
jgi:hypothetical protein